MVHGEQQAIRKPDLRAVRVLAALLRVVAMTTLEGQELLAKAMLVVADTLLRQIRLPGEAAVQVLWVVMAALVMLVQAAAQDLPHL